MILVDCSGVQLLYPLVTFVVLCCLGALLPLDLKLSSSRHCCWILQMLCASPSCMCVLWWQLRVLLDARIVVAGSCAFLSGEITLT
jgi:hypothetical protein